MADTAAGVLATLGKRSSPLLEQIKTEHGAVLGARIDALTEAVAADLTDAAAGAAASSASPADNSAAVSTAAAPGVAAPVSAAAAAPSASSVSASFSPFVVVPDVSCTTPRGKHDVEFSENSVVFRTKTAAAGGATLEVPRASIAGVFHLVTKEAQYLIIYLSAPVAIGKAQHSVLAICESAEALRKAGAAGAKKNASGAGLALPLRREPESAAFKDAAAMEALRKPAGGAGGGAGSVEGENAVALLRGLFSSLVGRVGETDLSLFKSSGLAGNPFAKCYCGVNDGMLFPLRRAFVFVGKPMLVLPHADIARCEVGRGGGGLQTFDLTITMAKAPGAAKAAVHTLSMIPRDEFAKIQAYVSTRSFGGGSGSGGSASSSSSSSSSSSGGAAAVPAPAAAATDGAAAASAGSAGDASAVADAMSAGTAASSSSGEAPAAGAPVGEAESAAAGEGSSSSGADAATEAKPVAAAPAAAPAAASAGARNMNEDSSDDDDDDDSDDDDSDASADDEDSDDDDDDDDSDSDGSDDDGDDDDDDDDVDDDDDGKAAAAKRKAPKPKKQKRRAASSDDDDDDDDGDAGSDDGVEETDVSDSELKALLAETGMSKADAMASTTRSTRRTRAAATAAVGAKRGAPDEAGGEDGGAAKRSRGEDKDDLFDDEE